MANARSDALASLSKPRDALDAMASAWDNGESKGANLMSNPVEPRKPLTDRIKAGEPIDSIFPGEAGEIAKRLMKDPLDAAGPELRKLLTEPAGGFKIPLPIAPPTDPAGDLVQAVAAQVSEALDGLVGEVAGKVRNRLALGRCDRSRS
jgi:hypothetical protein